MWMVRKNNCNGSIFQRFKKTNYCPVLLLVPNGFWTGPNILVRPKNYRKWVKRQNYILCIVFGPVQKNLDLQRNQAYIQLIPWPLVIAEVFDTTWTCFWPWETNLIQKLGLFWIIKKNYWFGLTTLKYSMVLQGSKNKVTSKTWNTILRSKK